MITIVAACVTIVAFVIFLQTRPPDGVERMGEAAAITPWVALATSVVGLLTALTNLVVTLRKKP
jgi:hypothetical protein